MSSLLDSEIKRGILFMRRSMLAVGLLVGGTLAGCSSSPGAPVAQSSTNAVAAPAAVSSSSSPPAPPAPAAYAATGTASDSQGDTATVSVSVGTPVPLTSIGLENVSSCEDDNFNYRTDQWMATPVQVTVTLTSSLAVPVFVSIDGTQAVDSSGSVGPNGNLPGWASSAQGSGNCEIETISWGNVAPGHPVTWSGWLMDPDAITPDDPNGSSAETEILLLPVLDFGSGDADFKSDAAASHNLVECGNLFPPTPEIAVDKSLAISRGCTAYTGS